MTKTEHLQDAGVDADVIAIYGERISEAMQTYADQQSIEFAKWMTDDIDYPTSTQDIEQMLKEFHGL